VINAGGDLDAIALTVTDDGTPNLSGTGSDTPVVTDTNDAPIDLNTTYTITDPSTLFAIDFDPLVSDEEDDRPSGGITLVRLTSLPDVGYLINETTGLVITQADIDNGITYDLDQISYQASSSDEQPASVLLGTKGGETIELANWGEDISPDGTTITQTLSNGQVVEVNSNSGPITQYNDLAVSSVGFGIGDNDGSGINSGEIISIDFNAESSESSGVLSAEIGLDGLGSYFYSTAPTNQRSAVEVTVTYTDGTTVNVTIYNPVTNDGIFHAISIGDNSNGGTHAIDTGGLTIENIAFGTIGPGSWELRYVDAQFEQSTSFDYVGVDSDGLEGNEATITVDIMPNLDHNLAPVAAEDVAIVDLDAINHEIDVLYNDADPDGDTLTIDSSSALNGSVAIVNGTLSYTPNTGFVGHDVITYTISDGNGGYDTATVAVTVLGADSDSNTIDEADLGNGSAVTVTGNIFDNDGLIAPNLISINDVTPNSGVISITTTDGNTLEVDSLGNYTYTLVNAVTHANANGANEFLDSFTYVVESEGQSFSENLNISIIDDVPTGSDISHNTTIDANTLTTNLTFIVDGSGSMIDADMIAVEDAIYALTQQYKAFSDITFNIVLFEHDGTQSTTWISGDNISTDSSGNVMITYPENGGSTTVALRDFLAHDNATNIAAGLNEVIDSYNSASDADQDIAYFFGDGEHNATGYDFDASIVNWTNFLAGTNGEVPIDALFSYSINTGSVVPDIAEVADSATGSVHREAENVTNVIDLTDAVLQDIVFIEYGELLTDSGSNTIDFGADGGHIQSVSIGDVIVTYDANNIVQNIDGVTGTYSIDFSTGTYTYSVDAIHSNFAQHSDLIEMVIVDNDGDVTNSTFTNNVNFSSATETEQVITSIDGAPSDIANELVFNVAFNGISSTPQSYQFELVNTNGILVDTSTISFSSGVTLNSDGTLNIPAGVSAFTLTSVMIMADEELTLTIGRNGQDATDSIAVVGDITDGDINYGIIQSGADNTITSTDDIEGAADIHTGSGDDTITVADDIKGNVQINTGQGNDTIVVGDLILDDVSINTGEGDDSIVVGASGSDAFTGELRNAVSITMGEGDDDLTISGIWDSSTVSIDLGTGNDTLAITGIYISTGGIIELGEGADRLELIGLSSTLFADGNTSNSTVTVDASGVPTITFTSGNNINFTVSSAETIYFGVDDTTYQFNAATGVYESVTTATIIDGIIAGLEYTTSSGLSGLTEDNGSFAFKEGDIVTFSIGNIVIGDIDMSTITDGQVFLQDIAQIDRSDMSDNYVENMAVLLQSLDNNGDAYDGIVITDAMREAFSDADFDLATMSEQELTAIIYQETGLEAVSEYDAMIHVGDMLEEYADISIEELTTDLPVESNGHKLDEIYQEMPLTGDVIDTLFDSLDVSHKDIDFDFGLNALSDNESPLDLIGLIGPDGEGELEQLLASHSQSDDVNNEEADDMLLTTQSADDSDVVNTLFTDVRDNEQLFTSSSVVEPAQSLSQLDDDQFFNE